MQDKIIVECPYCFGTGKSTVPVEPNSVFLRVCDRCHDGQIVVDRVYDPICNNDVRVH